MSYRRGLPHLVYYRALADESNEQSSSWRSTLAGLVAIRLVDAWAEGGPLPDAGLRALERAIHMMDVDALQRAPLTQLAGALRAEASGRDVSGQSPILVHVRGYAKSLWLTADWALAEDVCRTAIQRARTLTERSIVPSLYDRVGNCLRAHGQTDEALEAFETGRALACARGDLASDLHLRISEANLEEQRGNSALAERLLDEVLVDAKQAALAHLCARAEHDRGVIAYHREDYVAALSWYFRALADYGPHKRVERVLADIAAVILDIGFRDVARTIFESLERFSVEQVQRWTAALNLLDIAILDGDEAQFNFYRHKLASVQLSARLGAYYRVLVAEGWLRFEQLTFAKRALRSAEEYARRYSVNEIERRLQRCQQRLGQPANAPSAPLVTLAEPSSDLQPFLSRASDAVAEWQTVRRLALHAA
jgi:tetratricopeptide (TPR) repeat protein